MPEEKQGAVISVLDLGKVRSPVAGLTEKLIELAAFVKEMETQAHLIHLNYEGQNFLDVHRFLKERYEEHLAQFDLCSEHVRALDFWMPPCSCTLREALCSVCFCNVTSYDGRKQLCTYLTNLDAFAELARSIEPCAQEVGAIDVANSLADFVADAQKAAWMLKAILRGC